MSQSLVIHAENISKRYHIGSAQGRYSTLRDALAAGIRAPLQRASSLGRRYSSSKTTDVHATHSNLDTTSVVTSPSNSDSVIWALKDVSLEVQRGEVIGIIGRNGAGKSTLLKIFSRITKPTSGRAVIHGRVGSLLEVGTGFHLELTGRENIYLNGTILGMKRSEIECQFDAIVEFAEIGPFLDTPVKYYSSGMHVRLAFAVAAHLETDILLVDEVLAVGDAAFQKKCLGKMDDVSKQGRTILFVSHNMPTVQAFCQTVYLLQRGNIKASGKPEAVISQYLSEGMQVEAAETDLHEHVGRSHSQEKALLRAWLLDGQGRPTNTFQMGEPLTICFEFECSRKISNPGFGFGIEDELGRRVFSLNNYMTPASGNTFRTIQQGVATLLIPAIPLLPGTYFASLSLVEDQAEWVDFVEQAIAFHVQPADIYGSGKLPERSQGVIFIPGQIDVRDATRIL
jgi:lipopolysaccharide transport system ATP-binding protein